MRYNSLYKRVNKLVNTQNRKCDICGVNETMDNLILKYENGLYMCDDCMLEYYRNECVE